MRSAGLGRRDPWTPREFARVAGPSVPPAQEALASLTRGFERERYGGIAPDPTERARMEREADEVVSAAKRRRRDGGRARGGGSRRGGAPAGDSPTTEE
jgi:hypothetical protein